MKRSRWLLSVVASIPLIAASVVLQSCAGVGGPMTNGDGGGGLPGPTPKFLALLSAGQKGADYVGSEKCTGCHTDTGNHWKDTRHNEEGVGCERCHGPGGNHVALKAGVAVAAGPMLASISDDVDNAILAYPKINDPTVCAQCHGPKAGEYEYSAHTEIVVSPVQRAIDTPETYGRASRCIGCHSGLFRSAVIEEGIDIATMPAADIQKVAADALGGLATGADPDDPDRYTGLAHSAMCSTCHNPHKKTGNLTHGGKDVQLRRAVQSGDTVSIGPGKTPEEFQSINNVCAQCHNGRGTDPSDAGLEAYTARPSMHDSNQYNMLMGVGGVGTSVTTTHASAPGQCVKCHMPDSRHTFTVSYDKGCAPCHTASDAAARADTLKSTVLNGLDSLLSRMEAWALDKLGNKDYWGYSSSRDQTQVPIQVKRARHNYYFIIRSGDYGIHNPAYVKTLLRVANQNMDELNVPPAKASNRSMEEKLATIKAIKESASRADLEELR